MSADPNEAVGEAVEELAEAEEREPAEPEVEAFESQGSEAEEPPPDAATLEMGLLEGEEDELEEPELEEPEFHANDQPPEFEIPSRPPRTSPDMEDEDGAVGSGEEGGDGAVEGGPEEEHHASTLSLDEALLDRVHQVFVEPRNFWASLAEQRVRIVASQVFIVHGAEHSGKLTCAVRLASDLLGHGAAEKRIYYYRRTEEELSLLDLVQRDEIKSDRAYILEDAFPSVSPEDLEAPFLHVLNERLSDKKVYFVLTTEMPPGTLPAGVPRLDSALVDLEEVFKLHLDLYAIDPRAADRIVIEAPVLELARTSWQELSSHLKDPDQIDEFCRRVGAQGGQPDHAALIALAAQIAQRRIEAARPWFAGLELHEKLFAFLVALFPTERNLYGVFLAVVAELRGVGLILRDPREIGYDDLLDRTRSFENPMGEVHFEERAIGSEVEWQVKNYNHLLWSLVPGFAAQIQDGRGRELGDLRRRRAVAIARIGVHQPLLLREKLGELARHPVPAVAASAGYALSEICLRNRSADQEVCDSIRAWVNSGQLRLQWAATSCIFRVYSSLKRSVRDTSETRDCLLSLLESLLEGLEEQVNGKRPIFCDEDRRSANAIVQDGSVGERIVAKNAGELLQEWAKRSRNGALYAIEQIVAVEPKEMVARLGRWLEEGKAGLRSAAVVAIRRLFIAAGKQSGPPRQRYLAIGGLIEPVLQHCGDGSGTTKALFATVKRWVAEGVAPEAQLTLLRAASRLEGRSAQAFRTGVTPWLGSSNPKVRRFGRLLLGRSLLFDGASVPPPAGYRAVLAFDPALEGAPGGTQDSIPRQVWNLLQARLDLDLVRLGEAKRLAGPGDRYPSPNPSSKRFRPRLLLPAVGVLGEEGLDLVVVLALDPILDWEEVAMAEEARRVLLVGVGGGERRGEPPAEMRIEAHSVRTGLRDLSARIDEILLSTPDQAEPGEVCDADPVPALERRLGELEAIEVLAQPSDPAPALLRSLVRLAGKVPQRCGALLLEWFERDDLARRMALGVLGLLLRQEGFRPPFTREERALLFALVGKAVGCGGRGPALGFPALRRWLGSGEWAETLLGAGEAGEAPLVCWAEGLSVEVASLLERGLMDGLPAYGDEPAEIAERRTAVLDRLREVLAAHRAQPLAGERAMVEPFLRAQEEVGPPPIAAGGPRAPWIVDAAGFPLVWVEEIEAYVHWLPVTKLQLERFLAETRDQRFDDAWYRRILELNPRAGSLQVTPERYHQAFATGILPQEAEAFAAWCGEGFHLPEVELWKRAFSQLSAAAGDQDLARGPLADLAPPVRSLLAALETASAAARPPSSVAPTLADRMLLRRGVMEWVEVAEGAPGWGGMGEPSVQLKMLWTIARGALLPRSPSSLRSNAFGFRLICRPT